MKKKETLKICKLCHKEINLKKENYVRITDYKEGKFFIEGFYHNTCFRDNLTNIKGLRKMVKEQIEKASRMLNQVQMNQAQLLTEDK